MTTIVSDNGTLEGVFTDGDLRRVVESKVDLQDTPVAAVMTKNAQTVPRDMLAAEAMSLMERHRISALVVVDDTGHPQGILTLLALLKAGIS